MGCPVRQTNNDRPTRMYPPTLASARESGHDDCRAAKRTRQPWPTSATRGSARWTRTFRSRLDALAAAECAKLFENRASGVRADLQATLDYVWDGEVLVVWKLDRLGRSLPHLIKTLAALERCGVGFRSLTEAIDTTIPGGGPIFHICGALG